MKKVKYLTQNILYKTILFGKEYYYMEDVDGSVYLAKIDENGLPIL